MRRQKGWRKPDGAVVVARPSVFGNPFKLSPDGSRAEIVARYRTYLLDDPELVARARAELGWVAKRGLDEMCADAWRWQTRNPDGYNDAGA